MLITFIAVLASCTDDRTGPVTFEWDFDQSRSFKYCYSYIVTAEKFGSRKSLAPEKSYLAREGLFKIQPTASNTGEIVIIGDQIVTNITYDSLGIPASDSKIEYLGVANDNGRKVMKITAQGIPHFTHDEMPGLFLDILHALPGIPLQTNESFDVPQVFQTKINAYRQTLTGCNTLTFIGFENIHGVNCALLEGKIDVSTLALPQVASIDRHEHIVGKGSYYFDLEGGFIRRVEINSEVEFYKDSKNKEDREFVKSSAKLSQCIDLLEVVEE